MQFRLTNSQRYLVNVLALTIALTLLTLMVRVSGNPNPTNPTYPTNPTNPTNPTAKYGCEFVNLYNIHTLLT